MKKYGHIGGFRGTFKNTMVLAIVLSGVCFCPLTVTPLYAADFSDWLYSMEITFDGYAGSETLTNFPALVAFQEDSTGFEYSQLASDTGGDLRFADSDGNELNYEIDTWNEAGTSYVWVQVPLLTAATVITAYWGNNDETSAPSYTTDGSTWSQGYIGVYHLNEEGTVTTYNDSSPNNNDLTCSASPVETNGIIATGRAFAQGSTTQPIYKASPAGGLTFSEYTVTCWASAVAGATSWRNWWGLLRADNAYTRGEVADTGYPNHYNDGNLINASGHCGNAVNIRGYGWFHHVVTVSTNANRQTMFMNGVTNGAVTTNTWTGTGAVTSMKLGASYVARTDSCGVSLDEARISNVARSSDWVYAVYLNQASNAVFNSYGQATRNFSCPYKIKIIFSGYEGSTTLTNFPALVVLNENLDEFLYSDFASEAGADLRFANSNESVELNYEVEKWDTTGNSYIWVQVPELSGTNTFIWACWGNSAHAYVPDYTTDGSTWEDNYVGVWHLNETSGQHEDSTANANNSSAVTVSQQGIAEGQVDGATDFDGIDDSVTIPAISLTTNTVTWEAWVKGYKAGYAGLIFMRGTDPHASGMNLYDNKIGWHWLNDSAYSDTMILPSDELIHVAIVVTPTRIYTYTNGVNPAGQYWSRTVNNEDFSSANLMIGEDTSETRHWDGIIDEARFSKVYRSNDWLRACYLNQASNSVFNNYGSVADPQYLYYQETFEEVAGMAGVDGLGTTIHNKHGWKVSGGGSTTIVDDPVFGGVQAACMSNSINTCTIVTTNEATNVWIDCYLRPSRHLKDKTPSVNEDSAIAFFINSNGYVVALNDSTWVTNTSYTIPSNQWTRFSMNLDYANSTWRMDFAGDVSNALATNIFSGYSFQSTAANQYVSKVRIRNRGMGELACMDNLSVVIQSVDERPLNIDDDDDDLPDRWEFIYFGNLDKDGTADTDSDGITDLYEYAAGTDPTNATSYMRIADLDLDTETSSDVVLEVFGGLNSITSSVYLADEGAIPDRTFSILASTDPTATKTLADSITDDYSGANTWTDEGAVDLYDSRYYSISVSYDGYGYTNTEEWAMYKQSRPESEKVFICVPVDYGSAAANNLNSELGTQLGRGLYAGTDANDSDYLEYLENGSWEKVYWVASGGSNVWWGDGDIVDASITPGRAMWIHKNDTAQNTRSNAVFLGKSWTESTVTNFTSATNNMIYFGWALPIPGRHQNLTSDPWVDPEATPADQLGFAAAGASAGQTDDQYYPESLGDQIWIWNTNASGNYTWTDVYYLMGNWGDANYDDKWWDSSEGNFADFTLEPGRAYLYYHVGNQWENSALDWTPQDE